MSTLRNLAIGCCILMCQTTGAMAQTTNIADLQNWARGLPAAATWNVVGFNTTWQANQIRAGHRFLPSIFVPLNGPSTAYNSSTNTATINDYLTRYTPDIQYLSLNRVPVCLRTNNITSLFLQPQYSLPPDPANISKSMLTWSKDAAGNLTQGTKVDSFGPDTPFQTEGAALASSTFMQTLQTLYPTPPWWQYLENNEGPYEEYITYGVDANQNLFRPLDQVALKSSRMADFLTANSGLLPSQYASQFYATRQRKYGMYYSALNAGMTAGWRNKMRTAAYGASMDCGGRVTAKAGPVSQIGYVPEALTYNAGSKSLYVSQGFYSDYTALDQADALNQIPAWQWLEARYPNRHREFSLNISNGGAMAGAQAGKHLVMTPARYEGWIQWLLWSIRDKGVPVIIRQWTASNTLPSDPFFKLADWTFLQSQGLSTKINNLTQADYFLPMETSVDLICTNSTLRNYWQNGIPVVVPPPSPTDQNLQRMKYPAFPQSGDTNNYYRVLPCDVNTPCSKWVWDPTKNKMTGTMQVWAVAIQLDTKYLLYAWSPCKLTGNIQVTIPGARTVTIAAPQPWGYWEVAPNAVTKLNLSTTLPLN